MFYCLDHGIAQAGYQRPYYAVHALHNVGIMLLTAPDLYHSFVHFGTATEYPLNWWAIYLCISLHAYHVAQYLPSLRFDDWLHHGLMIGVAIPLGLNAPAGALFGANLFFTTGLPGLISYSLLFAERNRLLPKPRVQALNALTHLWIRAPGCVAHATLTLTVLLSAPSATLGQQIAGLLVAILTAWNGLYFMEQALASATSVGTPLATSVGTPLATSVGTPLATCVGTPFIHR